ncbi:MAG TPA: SRPBCC family protein [Rhodanobacteraceae bacterium]|nr:SRPBCC family protein [Rhodanobacteraceae bacterium]
MHKAYYSAILNSPVDHVWRLVRDFNDYPKYIEGVNESQIEDDRNGDEIGAVRRFCYGGAWIRQRLTAHSDDERSFSYAGLDPFPFPVASERVPAAIEYSGTLRLAPIVDGNRTFAEWFVEFEACSEDAAPWQGLLMQLIPQWMDSLGRAAEAR